MTSGSVPICKLLKPDIRHWFTLCIYRREICAVLFQECQGGRALQGGVGAGSPRLCKSGRNKRHLDAFRCWICPRKTVEIDSPWVGSTL